MAPWVGTGSVGVGEKSRGDKPGRRACSWITVLSAYFAIANAISAAIAVIGIGIPAVASADATADAGAHPDGPFTNVGPYNDTFLEGGIGVARALSAGFAPVAAAAPWSMGGWIRSVRVQPGEVVVAAVGTSAGGAGGVGWHGIYLTDGELAASLGAGLTLRSGSRLEPGRWYAVAVTYDGAVAKLYVDGGERAEKAAATAAVEPRLELAPVVPQEPANRPEGHAGVSLAPVVAQEPPDKPAGHFGASPAQVVPPGSARKPEGHFGGSLAQFTLQPFAQTPQQVKAFAQAPPDFELITFTAVGVGWPWQEHAWRGLQEPQDPWTLPHAKSPPSAPVAVAPEVEPAGLQAGSDGASLIGGWRLMPAPLVSAGGGLLSETSFTDRDWYPAIVPGTVLSTLIARGVYPDPDYGLNNLAIPDTLSRQAYWYRSVFSAPGLFQGRDLTLVFKGINYTAEVWLNGRHLGEIRGAFTRGTFDVTGMVRAGESNALAVRIAPPPHPGIPHEQSMSAGPGNNGGALAIDGPTFIASEGWDWIPGIRDRNTGIWQTVEIKATGVLHLGDPHVVTHLPLPRTDTAEVAIAVPIVNHGTVPARGTVIARFDGVRVEKTVTLPPGETEITLDPEEFAELHVKAPRLWWPNGYGAANLHALHIEVLSDGVLSDSASLRFGIRELTYELSLFDHEGRLRRVEVDPTRAARGEGVVDVRHETIKRTAQGWAESETPGGEASAAATRRGERVVDVRHETIKSTAQGWAESETPGGEASAAATRRGERVIDVRHEAIKRTPQGWAESLTPAGETSPAVKPSASVGLSPYLVIRVNGVPIAARGGSWGMDDSRKRSSRERLEPYFRLHRDANLNIIRNWLGQNTEEVFYDLADEYGLLVLNDFWVSTQDFQMEPEDPALFLANARDVISRFRNHPSIAVWFGRNEGVPQPILNEGLADLAATLDGTRYYTGSSNSVNLQGSGPYDYRPPEQYFTELARGFSVEVGTPSLSTLESLRASIPAADRWPLNDTYAYHDWHFGGNGDVATFMAALAEQYGAGTSLEDFERKAQLMNYVSYRAIFEGFQAHLWTRNSGRLLWMTHPSWPSNTWQIYSADYDTAAAYYAVKKACEPVHAQLNLPDFGVAVVNTTQNDQRRALLRSRVWSLDNKLLGERVDRLDARANSTTTLAPLAELLRALPAERLVLVQLALKDGRGELLSENFYWQGFTPADQQRLNELKPQAIDMAARGQASSEGQTVTVRLFNPGLIPVLNAKITLLDEVGERVLPVYYSDNYVTLLPGAARVLTVRCPAGPSRCARVALRGWNVVPGEARVEWGRTPRAAAVNDRIVTAR